MKLYLSGPITGKPDDNKPLFGLMAERLRAAGHEVVNPHEICIAGQTWAQCMKVDIAYLLTCDAVAMLPGWSQSRGATIEINLAEQLGMSCRPVGCWLVEVSA